MPATVFETGERRIAVLVRAIVETGFGAQPANRLTQKPELTAPARQQRISPVGFVATLPSQRQSWPAIIEQNGLLAIRGPNPAFRIGRHLLKFVAGRKLGTVELVQMVRINPACPLVDAHVPEPTRSIDCEIPPRQTAKV